MFMSNQDRPQNIAGSSPDDATVRGWEVYRRALSLNWPRKYRRVIAEAALDLADALGDYGDLRNGIVLPYFPGMPAGPEGFTRGLCMVGEDVAAKTDELVRILPACEMAEAMC